MNEQKMTAAIDKAWSRLTEEAGLVGGAVSVVKDGKIVAREMKVIHDCGSFTELGLYATEKNANLGAGPNMIENLAIDSQMVYTNKMPSGSRRGFGVNIGLTRSNAHQALRSIAAALGLIEIHILRHDLGAGYDGLNGLADLGIDIHIVGGNYRLELTNLNDLNQVFLTTI